ncbi:MAG: hypothetical protein ACLFU4_07010 [Opitutales bacterium]
MQKSPADHSSSRLFGRDELLAWLESQVFQENGAQARHCPLILLHGPDGIGKSAVSRQFVRTHLDQPASVQPLLVFDWRGGVQGRSILQFSRLLFQMGKSNLPVGERHLADLPNAGGSGALPVGDDGTGPDQTYREDGVAEEVLPQRKGLKDSDQRALAEEFVDRVRVWLGADPGAPSASAVHSLAKVIFVFDNFERYHVSIRQWVGRYMYPIVSSDERLPDCAYLFTGEQAWEACGFADYWEVPPGSLREYRLEPLTPSDCRQWLKAVGLKEDLLEILIEETEGIPGRVAPLLEHPDRLRALEAEGTDKGELSQFSAKQRRWLHAASMRASLPYEAFELMLGRAEARQALLWLQSQAQICRVKTGSDGIQRIEIEDGLRTRIFELASDKIPLRHDEYVSRLQLMQSLSGKVPLPQHREYLKMLSPVKPINEEAIRYVYGQD